MDDLRIYIFFNSISVISGQWADDNERMRAMEPAYGPEKFALRGARTQDFASICILMYSYYHNICYT